MTYQSKLRIKELLLEEHSKAQCKRIVEFIGNDEARFKILVEIFLGNDPLLTQRAAWPLGVIGEYQPWWTLKWLPKFLDHLEKKGVHEAGLRNITRALQYADIPERYSGRLMDICFRFIASPTTPVAVKANSITILENFAGKYPDILQELISVIHDRFAHETAAFKSRAMKILKKYHG